MVPPRPCPHYKLKDLARLDNRVEAHLDGLRIAGDAGWEICREALSIGEPGEVFAAASLAFVGNDEERINTVLETVGSSPELARALVSALGWLPWDAAELRNCRCIAASAWQLMPSIDKTPARFSPKALAAMTRCSMPVRSKPLANLV